MHSRQNHKDFKTKLLEELGTKAKPEGRYVVGKPKNLKVNQGERQAPSQPKRQLLNQIKIKNIQLSPERYSPWRSEEL